MCAAKTHQLKTMMKCAMVAKLSKSDGVPVEVAPGVLLGSIGCVALQENLDAAGVTHILTVANAILPLYATLHAALLACNVTARLLGVPPGLTASTRTRWCLSPTPCPRTYSRSSRTASVSLTRTCSQRVNGKLSSGVPEGDSCLVGAGHSRQAVAYSSTALPGNRGLPPFVLVRSCSLWLDARARQVSGVGVPLCGSVLDGETP